MDKKKRNILILAVVIVIALVGGIAIYQHTRPKEVTNYAFEDDQQAPNSKTSEAGVTEGIQIPGYKEIVVNAGTTEASVELTNPEGNDVYFEISFYLPDTDEVLYTSKLIKPGQSIYNITLNHAMEAGEYPLVIKYATFSADENMTPRNGAELNCPLIVQ